MLRLLAAFTAYDVHAARMAERFASTSGRADCAAEVCDLARSRPPRPLEDYDEVIVGGSLHGGNHPPQLVKFVAENGHTLSEPQAAFVSVSLSAAGKKQQQDDAAGCLNESLDDRLVEAWDVPAVHSSRPVRSRA